MSTQEPTNQYERRKAGTNRELREALVRLRARTPLNEAVLRRKWKLDVKTLAEEAGVSRNTIYQNHREIIEELRTAQGRRSGSGTNSAGSETMRLKRRVREIEQEQRLLVTQNAELLARAQHAENELKELKTNHRTMETD